VVIGGEIAQSLSVRLVVLCFLLACGSTPDVDDAGALPVDAFVSDSGTIDAGSREDAGALPQDAGPPPSPGAGCGNTDYEAGNWTVNVGGTERRFVVRIPESYDPDTPTPVVLNFHGLTNDAAQQEALSEMTPLAEREGFVVVYGQGVGRSWNAGSFCCGTASSLNVDDVGFVDAMLDRLEATLCVDERRIYSTGMSNGGYFTTRLACQLADRIAAFAPVAGTSALLTCNPSRPVAVFHVHGTADTIVPYGGAGFAEGVRDRVDAWVAHDACDELPLVDFEEDDVLCETWSGCEDDVEVRLCTIEGGGHNWPGGPTVPGLGRTSDTIHASEEIWRFFQAHPLPE